MAVLTLPTEPTPSAVTVGVVSTSNVLTPEFGGDDQEVRRKGSRYVLTFTLPPMAYIQAIGWDDLFSEGDTVCLAVPQPGLVIAPSNAPRVKGAGQGGRVLMIDGVPPGYAVRKGQFVSVITGGQRFLYRTALPAVANAGGELSLALRHLLRRPPADNDVVEIEVPRIEGFVRDASPLTVGIDHLVNLQFSIRERE